LTGSRKCSVDEARWLEVSLTLNSELAEAAAEVLTRFIPNGVVIESSVAFLNEDDTGTPLDTVRVYGYIPIDEHIEATRQRLEEALWHLSQIQPLPEPAYRPLHDQDWMAAWKQHYHPIPIGSKLLILPAWIEQHDTARIPVRIDPGMAFGTGTHPSTQLCLEMLETYVRPGQPIIDIGCGSGILAIGAALLGSSAVYACDVDPLAAATARENCARNRVAHICEVEAADALEALRDRFDVIVANVHTAFLLNLIPRLPAHLAPGGRAILSGAGESSAPALREALAATGFRVREHTHRGEWIALLAGGT